MNILALNGSRRKSGNTSILIETLLAPAIQKGAEVRTVFLGDYEIGACTGCEGCRESWECVIKDDFARVIEMMDMADGLVLASPTYWYTVTSDMKRFIDRCYSLIRFPENRHEWIGKYDAAGKVCVTAAVCEQHEESMMGHTLELLTDFSKDIGLEVVASLKVLGCFEAGSIRDKEDLLADAAVAGETLFNSIQARS